jgi:RNA polymerase sigma factor (sigma-70 family)
MRATVANDDATTSGLEELYVRHAPDALRLSYALCGDPEAARDLVHDAFVRVAGRFRHLRQPDDFAAYLRRTVVNLHVSRLRRLRVERSSLTREASFARGRRGGLPRGPGRDVARDPQTPAPPARRDRPALLRGPERTTDRRDLRCSVGAVNQLVVRAMADLRGRPDLSPSKGETNLLLRALSGSNTMSLSTAEYLGVPPSC